MKRAGRKALVMWLTAVVSAAVLVATAFAAASNVSGYEALKQSGFAFLEQRGNSTAAVSVEIFSDGEMVASQNMIMQINEDQDARYTRSETFAIGEDTFWSEHYWDSDNMYYMYSDSPNQYDVISNSYGAWDRGSNQVTLTENQKKLAGILMDLFTGDVKNYFMVDGNTVSVSLNRNQIPELIQSFLAVGAERVADEGNLGRSGMDGIAARYLYNPVIESGTMTAVLSDNGCPAKIDGRINFSGMDEDGGSHNASIIINMTFSDVGNTVVKTFDPKGKTLRNNEDLKRIYFSADEDYEFESNGSNISITITGDQPAADEIALEIESD